MTTEAARLHTAMLVWLREQEEGGGHPSGWAAFMERASTEEGGGYELRDVEEAAEYLAEEQLISSLASFGAKAGTQRPKLTVDGRTCVRDFGGDVNSYLGRAARSIYSYDTSNRLTAVTNYGGHDYAYTYDKASNRTNGKVDGATTQTLTYNSGNQISSTGYSHDAAGNRTADPAQGTFTYNAAGQTTTRTNGSSSSNYTWGGGDQNELVSKTTGTNTTSYVYGRNDRNGVPMVQSITRNGQTSYIDYDPTGSPIALQGPGGSTDYYALDNQGTPINLVNGAGTVSATYTYDPAGKQLAATGTSATLNPLRYTQGVLDEDTGWIKHGVRYHDTTTANWTAQDPLSQLLEPDDASRYAYVSGNPANLIDPTGLYSWYDFESDLSIVAGSAAIGGVIGAGVGSVVPVIGTGAGGIGGSILGLEAGLGAVYARRCQGNSDCYLF